MVSSNIALHLQIFINHNVYYVSTPWPYARAYCLFLPLLALHCLAATALCNSLLRAS